jgi:hypothetical protein
MSVTFLEELIPGDVLRGFRAVDPEPVIAPWHAPGLLGEIHIFNGMKGRPIIVPMLVHHEAFGSYDDCAQFLRKLEARKAEGEIGPLSVDFSAGNESFDDCRFMGYELSPNGILPTSGTLEGDYFFEAVFLWYQLRAVP